MSHPVISACGSLVKVFDFIAKYRCEAVEGLSECHRNGILKLCAPHLDDVCELFSFLAECGDKPLEHRDEPEMRRIQAEVDCGRVGVVGGLCAVDMVVRRAILVFAAFVPHDFESPVGYDLVGVHIGRGTGAALYHVDREFLPVLPVKDFLASRNYGVLLLVRKESELVVGDGSSHLGICQAVYE